MPQAPPGSKKTARPEAIGEEPPPGVKRRRAEPRRRYLVRTRLEEEVPLEPPILWSAFFCLFLGICTAVFSGSLAPVGLAFGLAACGLGVFALVQSFRLGGKGGMATAIAGMVLAIGFSGLHSSDYNRGRSSLRSLQSLRNRGTGTTTDYHLRQAEADFQTIDRALREYHDQLEALPPSGAGSLGVNGNAKVHNPAFAIPTFRIHQMAYDNFLGLTTPVAYLGRLPQDGFAPDFEATYGYYPSKDEKFALIFSPGPDRRYQIDPKADFVPGDPGSRDALLVRRWDPTNGTRSAGDLWYVVALPQKSRIDPATGLPLVAPNVPPPPPPPPQPR